MAAEKGRRAKTGGRRKGTPNRATATRQAAVAASGLSPLDVMLAIMRDEKMPVAVRCDMAKAAAPYVHPRLASVEVKGKAEEPIAVKDVSEVSELEIARRIAFVLTMGIRNKAGNQAADTNQKGNTA